MQNLRASYLDLLRRWGIVGHGLTKNLLNLVEKAMQGQWSSTFFMAQVRHTPEYHKQFFGIRLKDGMTEGQYLSTYAQFRARAQDVGMKFTKNEFARTLKRGLSFEEFSDRVDAVQTFEQYQPMWNQFKVVLQERGINVPDKHFKKEMTKFIMGRGSKQWEQVWQETYLTANLEKVAGVSVIEKGKGESATPDALEIGRGDLLSIIKQVEGLSGGKFDVESLTPQAFADLGDKLRKYNLSYMRRYGLDYKDLIQAELGGNNAAAIRAKGAKILAEQEGFLQPRALPGVGKLTKQAQGQQGDDLVQSR